MARIKRILLWECVVDVSGDAATVTPIRPIDTVTCSQAAKILGLGKDRVQDLYKAGLISGHKPGAASIRSDGRRSNATIRLDSESVAAYHSRQVELAKAEREA